jgi:hypothetical protein
MRWTKISFTFILLLTTLLAGAPINAVGQSSGVALPVSTQLAVAASIPLRQGWNLVASPVIPNDPAAASVFASIAGLFDVAYAYDACDAADPWKKYDPKAPPIANDLTTVSAARGIWIKASTDTTWIVSGTTPARVDIPLCAGQNLISYPSVGTTALPDALASIADRYSKVYSFDSADALGLWKVFDPQAPTSVNDLTALGPTRGYWIEMKTPATLTVGSPAGASRRVNAPYFDGGVKYSEMAVSWFGRITPAENYADVRMGYNQDELVVNVAAFDRRLWYDTSPSAADLTAWDAVTLYLSLDGGPGSTLSANAYRFVGQLTWWEDPRTQWQAAYRHNGTAWIPASLPFASHAGWRGDAPNNDEDDRGWNISFDIPFSSLGLSGPPSQGTTWRVAIVLHDRDDAAGTPIPDKTWPETIAADQPATWGVLNFGVPSYTPPAATPGGTVTIRHKLNGAIVSDAAVGGYAVCGAGTDYWTEWGNTNESFYSTDHDRFNVQNQSDISDWPCFSKYYVTFPLNSLPAGKVVLSATLTLHQIGNAGEGWTPTPQPSFIQILTVDRTWDEATLTWNNAASASENITGSWVDPLPSFPGWPGVPRQWNVSRAVAQAYATGQPMRLAVYSADEPFHSGRFFSSSDVGDWDEAGRPTLTVAWGEPR